MPKSRYFRAALVPTAGDDPKTSHVGGRNAQLATRGLRPIVIFCAAHMEMDMTGFRLFAASASVLLLLLPARSEEGTAHRDDRLRHPDRQSVSIDQCSAKRPAHFACLEF